MTKGEAIVMFGAIFLMYVIGFLTGYIGHSVSHPIHRPACFVEPSKMVEGYEVVWYGDVSKRGEREGWEVPCK